MTDEQRKRKNECARENSQWKKERHLCVRCGKQDAYTLVGRTLCYECAEKQREYYHKCPRDKLNNRNLRERERYHKNIELGVCPKCLKQKEDDGYVHCSACRAKIRKSDTKYRQKKGVLPRCLLDGIDRCAICGREEVVDGHKVCSRCLENCRKSLKKASNTPREANYFEKSIRNYFNYWRNVRDAGKIERQG